MASLWRIDAGLWINLWQTFTSHVKWLHFKLCRGYMLNQTMIRHDLVNCGMNLHFFAFVISLSPNSYWNLFWTLLTKAHFQIHILLIRFWLTRPSSNLRYLSPYPRQLMIIVLLIKTFNWFPLFSMDCAFTIGNLSWFELFDFTVCVHHFSYVLVVDHSWSRVLFSRHCWGDISALMYFLFFYYQIYIDFPTCDDVWIFILLLQCLKLWSRSQNLEIWFYLHLFG